MKVGIVGLGYVGLPLAVAFAEAGCEVVGVDTDPARVERLRRSESRHRGRPLGAAPRRSRNASPPRRVPGLAACDAIVICVPTPLANHREPDLSYLVDAATPAVAGSSTKAGWSCSSRPPIREPPASACSRSSRSPVWRPAGSSTSPIRPSASIPGRTDHTIRTTPKVVGGLTDDCRRRAAELYGLICDEVVEVSSPGGRRAHASCSRTSSARSTSRSSTSSHSSATGWASTSGRSSTRPRRKPFGFMRFEPGPGMGGHCLPVDPFYLAFKARQHDFATEFVELAGQDQPVPAALLRREDRADAQRREKPVGARGS